MEEPVVVADANKTYCRALCAMLEVRHYRATPVYSFQDLERYLQKNICLAAVLNINTLSIDNRIIRELTKQNPGVYFLGLTNKPANPDLKEALCYHIFACLTIPVDLDELVYWLRCIHEDATG